MIAMTNESASTTVTVASELLPISTACRSSHLRELDNIQSKIVVPVPMSIEEIW